MPDGVVIWAATSHAAVREVLQGDERLLAKHLSNWKTLRGRPVRR
jgi:2-hydroxy-5-methyl-1-naphthoate 7-hydroxylase